MTMIQAALTAGFASFAFCLMAPAAAASGPPEAGAVIFEVAGCAPRIAADTRRIVGIELGGLLLPPAAPPERRAAADCLAVTCEAGAADLVATGGPGRAMVRRRVPVADLPGDVAARAMALAGIEMLAALSPAVRAQVAARAPEPPAATTIAPPSERNITPAPSVRLAILLGVRTFSSRTSLLAWGGGIDVQRLLGGFWGLAGNLEVVAGGASSALGDAHEQLASLAGYWEAAARGAHWAGAVGLGGRVGLARFVGTAPSGSGVGASDVLRPWAGPALSIRAWLGSRSIPLTFLGEVGFAIRGAQGLSGNDVVLAASGGCCRRPWVSGSDSMSRFLPAPHSARMRRACLPGAVVACLLLAACNSKDPVLRGGRGGGGGAGAGGAGGIAAASGGTSGGTGGTSVGASGGSGAGGSGGGSGGGGGLGGVAGSGGVGGSALGGGAGGGGASGGVAGGSGGASVGGAGGGVATTALACANSYDFYCGIKGGQMACWASANDAYWVTANGPALTRLPANLVQFAMSNVPSDQTPFCGVDASGTGTCWGATATKSVGTGLKAVTTSNYGISD